MTNDAKHYYYWQQRGSKLSLTCGATTATEIVNTVGLCGRRWWKNLSYNCWSSFANMLHSRTAPRSINTHNSHSQSSIVACTTISVVLLYKVISLHRDCFWAASRPSSSPRPNKVKASSTWYKATQVLSPVLSLQKWNLQLSSIFWLKMFDLHDLIWSVMMVWSYSCYCCTCTCTE